MNKHMMAMTGLLAACAAHSIEPEAAYEQAQRSVSEDLAALDALQLVEVRGLVVDQPCSIYVACPDDEQRMARYVEQAERLHALVDLAEDDVDELGPCYTTASDIVERSVAAIEALQIVDLGELLLEEAAPEPNCYNLPCADELARVDEINERRALILYHLAERAQGL